MRVWTVRASVAQGHNWFVERDGRLMAMFSRENRDDADFMADACNEAEWRKENPERTAGHHAPGR